MKTILPSLLLIVFLPSFPLTALPEDETLPRIAIPEASESGESRLIIDAKNAAQFRNVLIPELYPLVKDDRLTMGVVRSLRHDFKLDAQWEDWSRDHSGEAAFLLNKDPVKEEVYLKRGFPFGRAKAIADTPDSRVQAQKILWNGASVWWGLKLLQMEMTFRVVQDEMIGTESKARIERIYPMSIDEGTRSFQLFREVMRFTDPPALNSFSFLTFRLLSMEEDLLWTFSPAISKVRQLTGSNRGDPILFFILGLDDLLGWSGNIRMLDADITGAREVLLPYAEVGERVLRRVSSDEKENICVRVSSEGPGGRKGFAEWSLDAPFPAGNIPLPTSAVFVPRQVWRLELSSRDPYALAGRQILYVDQEMMLPVVNVVFDRSGRLWKFILTGLGLAQGEGRRAPFQAFQVAVDVRENRAVLNSTDGVMYCDTYQPGVSLADFDPSRLAPVKGK